MGEKLLNLGPVSSQWLAEVGVDSYADLERLGSVSVYAMVKQHEPKASLNLLWALEAALRKIDWRKLTEEDKKRLRAEFESLTDS